MRAHNAGLIMRKSYWILIPALSGLLTGCKLEVASPEGGSVESQSGSYVCAAGQPCSIDVVDLYFDETFVARPEQGYTFKEWKQSPRYFCGGRKAPCRLFTSTFEGIEPFEELLAGEEVFYLEPVFRSCQGGESLGTEVESIRIPDPGLSCFSKGDTVKLNAIIRDSDGNRLPSDLVVWRSTNRRVASVDSNGLVTAQNGGKVWIEASYKYDCENRFTAVIPMTVLDLTGSWTVTEVADERACEEGINTYTMNIKLAHTGNKITFSTPIGSGSGTISGCQISGLSREFEDDGLTYSEGTATVAPGGNTISASARWVYRDSGYMCSGTSTETYRRN